MKAAQMKNAIKVFGLLSLLLFVGVSCRDKDSEKKIAQLESRLAELEGKDGSAVAPGVTTTPAATPEPEVKPEGPLAALSFETVTHDFGTIKEGDIVEFTYKFSNTGEVPLVIENAVGSCGCTVPDWSKTPVDIGKQGFVTAKFDSNGKKGFQTKTVTVTANTWPKQVKLEFKANVLPKEPS